MSTALQKVQAGQRVSAAEKGVALRQSVSALDRMRAMTKRSNLRMSEAATSGGRVAAAGAAAGIAAYARGRMDKVDVKGVDVPLLTGGILTLAGIAGTAKGMKYADAVTGLGEGLLIETIVRKARGWGEEARSSAGAPSTAPSNTAPIVLPGPQAAGEIDGPPVRRVILEREPALAGRGLPAGFEVAAGYDI